jgi:diguanylate cyclase (GGDEF)-like protein
LQRYESANRIGRLATEIAHRQGGVALLTRANFFHAAFIQHWCEPLEATLPFFEEGWKIGVETGDLQFSSYCINHIHGNGLLAGQSLAELEQSLKNFESVNRIIRQEDGQHFFSMLKRTVDALRKPVEALPDLMIDHGGITMVEEWRKCGNATILMLYHVLRCLQATILCNPVVALESAQEATAYLDGLKGMTWVPHHNFLHSLALTDAIREGYIDRAGALNQISGYRNVMEAWAVHSPNNYRPKQLLIEAEMVDLAAEDAGVLLNAYEAAIDAAEHAGRIVDQALSCERAAYSWLRRNKPQLASFYMQRAIASYTSWGAEAKVAQLKRDSAALLIPPCPTESGSSVTSNSSNDSLQTVDIYSVVKAAQTVAGELVMDRMLARLIGLVIETAGAQSGFLLLREDDEWRVVAARLPDNTRVEVLQWRALKDYPEIAATVVQYVARTIKPVNLDDATKSTLFATDSSIIARQCKSLLCLPVVNRGELAGILYLENNLSAHAFTRTHTRVLHLLTTQAISSLEISRYYARVQDLNRSLEAEIEEHKHTESKLAFLANHDALTELPNRRLFYDRTMHAIQRAQRNGDRVAVLYLDLDQFKNINDTLTHQVGDILLQQVAQRLTIQVRKEDTLGRLGGDEYVLLMEGDLDPHSVSTVADKLLAAFHEPFHVAGYDLYPTGSLGISLFPDDAADADQLLQNADAAMYQAKKQGRNNYHFFSADLAEAAVSRLSLERELRRAIERKEFELYFQPQVLLQTGKITGAEALLRWNHPSRGLLLPGSFISMAEESGSIIPIGEWVLRQACKQLEQWRGEGREISCLAVNVSGGQIGPHSGFVKLVKGVLEESKIDPSSLELELTESVILQDTDFTMQALDHLNNLGLRLAIDDFGTGYSSLSYLHRLPVQRLKIDRSFVNGLPDAKDSAMIVQSILSLGQNLGKEIIAEGIESATQSDFLQQVGCTEGQGYLFGEPMPLAAFNELLS